jgi:hypothetical protein
LLSCSRGRVCVIDGGVRDESGGPEDGVLRRCDATEVTRYAKNRPIIVNGTKVRGRCVIIRSRLLELCEGSRNVVELVCGITTLYRHEL